MPKLGFWDSEIPESHPKIPVVSPHLPHFALQNPKIAFSRVSRQPPPRCSRGRGGGLEYTVICTGFAGWWTATMGRDGSTIGKNGSTMGRNGSTMTRDGGTRTRRRKRAAPASRDGSTSMEWWSPEAESYARSRHGCTSMGWHHLDRIWTTIRR